MNKYLHIEQLQAVLVFCLTSAAAYFDSTLSFLVALMLAFFFNIFAGFRADEVRFKMLRLYPPSFCFENFKGNKLKDSLMELFLITFITYFLKGIAELMKYETSGYYIVQFLIAIAIYYYFRSSLRNLQKAYPKNSFIALIYFVIAFKLKQIIGAEYMDMVDKNEK